MEPWKNNEIKDVNAASALNLKAELLKQNEIFQQERRKYGKSSQSIVRKPIKKPTVFSKKNKGIELRKLKDKEEIKTAGSELEASWISLQRKAKIYEEQLKKDVDDLEDEDENSEKAPLVDFLNKKIENMENLKQKLDEKEQEVEDSWVEYVDEFGRSRLIRKSDMEKYNIKSNIKETEEDDKKLSEMTKEELREEQEKHLKEELEQEERERNEETYFDAKMENRIMGIGYYQFSHNKEERLKQQEALEELRHSTTIQRQKVENMKQARNHRIEERKRKLKERMENVKRQKKLYNEKKETVEKETEDFLKSFLK
ncbi:hypothetical protein BCR36DRAFT_411662 [Piromyces finnis]|uniref:CCDC174 alpha/beta GRSR domain-containing protein n=1 Tax=Piromyces finnis TaxID=1754191 RepID=A0A1Y1VDU0_9FUNG|nr:hypothetical protein BCR36DRAFT_411662 [Piromyces finnis]|eukprot:ORX52223.1 hypothetical protein BCR36DRAFT_411662 [Piromyces finnis]